MHPPSLKFIYSKFLQYYHDKASAIEPPPKMQNREFGFLLFEKGRMIRHKGFRTVNDFRASLREFVPTSAYYSSAYYERPAADEMNQKGWLGADLIFDIDADHIPSLCGKVHDSWRCVQCDFTGKGPTPKTCPSCAKTKFDEKKWNCEVCLEGAKKEAKKLVDMLIEDFGLENRDVKAYFSGNRGYHVHVESGRVHQLDSGARKEIVDYVIGLGLKAELHRLLDGERVAGDSTFRTGWNGRVINGIRELLAETDVNEIERIGLSKRAVNFLDTNKKTLLESFDRRGWLNVKGVGFKNWKKIVQWITDKQSSKIDTVVTTDIHRLIRLDGSLHGKTGFKKIEAPLHRFDNFDPLKEAVAFKEGEVAVEVEKVPKFRVGATYYGPFKNTSHVKLPVAVALFLLCKGVAKVM